MQHRATRILASELLISCGVGARGAMACSPAVVSLGSQRLLRAVDVVRGRQMQARSDTSLATDFRQSKGIVSSCLVDTFSGQLSRGVLAQSRGFNILARSQYPAKIRDMRRHLQASAKEVTSAQSDSRSEKGKAKDTQEEDEDEDEEEEEEVEEEEEDVELTDEELKLTDEVEAELKGLVQSSGGGEIGRGVSWRFAEDDELEVDEYEDEEEDNTEPGDGLDGGGVVLGGAPWAEQVLALTQALLRDPKHEGLALFGFRVYPERKMVKIRLDKLADKWGSPPIEELECFLTDLHALVLQAEERQDLPADVDIEVGTPGAERVVQVPKDLTRFAHSPMYVCYNESEAEESGQLKTRHEVFELVEVDVEGEAVIWKMADVRVNRELLGKGRRLNKKQRETKIRVPFADIQVVRLYLDV